MNLSKLQIRSRYFSPHSFVRTILIISQNALSSSFSVCHNNVRLKGNIENIQTHLEELEFHFDVLGILETKITNSNVYIFTPLIPGYNFEFAPTPLASGGVALFIDEKHNYRVLKKNVYWSISSLMDKNFSCKEKECNLRYYLQTA